MARILVAEENRGWQRFMKVTLEEKGYRVVAVNGAAAALLELMRGNFDILLVNYKFSYDLLHTAQERCPERIPPIVVTLPAGKTALKRIIEAELAKMNLTAEFLPIPCGMSSLREIVKKVLSVVSAREALISN